ncbi:MAG: efflux RND transporter periplasmic adaptor subunit [Bacteroidales bacterium]|nr:efflux RND transporter periplasmic adaptor subunit [Bacteroidales bacterium]MDD3907727.1 efflux RND transporter periplasmic adaptor subunit [Bacteroidales bacterium]MDD4712550.1 efflux RND transporter periplasmic adaptor subunit [Bacteroidales bacterium]
MSKKIIPLSVIITLVLFSCKSNKEESKPVENATPVTITQIQTGRMDEVIELNATSVFQVKSYVKSPVNGYLQIVNARLGESIGKGHRLFVIRSKEAENLASAVNKLDTAFHFKGITNINAPCNGYITELTYRSGDYVQDGETLAAISDAGSLVFMLELPYDLKPFLANNKTVTLTLPDHTKLSGRLTSAMPIVDPVSQTQSYIIKLTKNASVPENLIAKVAFVKNFKPHVISLPKEAVLTNEIQSEYWIMKMAGTSTAVKVPVIKGMESHGRVEIISPRLTASDKILLTGNYGLPDTAKVYLEK